MDRFTTRARLAAASEKTANAHRIGRATLGVLAVALLLGAVPPDARAQACKATGIKPKAGCVTSSDIRLKQKKPVIGQKHRRDEAGVAFNKAPLENQSVDTRFNAVFFPPVFTGLKTKVPAPGVIVLTASTVIIAISDKDDAFGTVQCDFMLGGSVFDNRTQRLHGFAGSVREADGFPSDTMEFLTAFEVNKKGDLSLDLGCGLIVAGGIANNVEFVDTRAILMRPPSLVVQYFPTRYCPRKRDGSCR